jgi:sulfide:quinone oxidoreductase
LIVGGGNAGLSVAAQLLAKQPNLEVSIIEPSKKHYYQPAWTLVGAGTFDIRETEKTKQIIYLKMRLGYKMQWPHFNQRKTL